MPHCNLPLPDFPCSPSIWVCPCSSVHQSHGSQPPRPDCRLQPQGQHSPIPPPYTSHCPNCTQDLMLLPTQASYSHLQFFSGKVKNGKSASKAQNKYKYLPGLYITCKREYHLSSDNFLRMLQEEKNKRKLPLKTGLLVWLFLNISEYQ